MLQDTARGLGGRIGWSDWLGVSLRGTCRNYWGKQPKAAWKAGVIGVYALLAWPSHVPEKADGDYGNRLPLVQPTKTRTQAPIPFG